MSRVGTVTGNRTGNEVDPHPLRIDDLSLTIRVVEFYSVLRKNEPHEGTSTTRLARPDVG